MTKYADIIERLEKAQGPAGDLGAAVLVASGSYVLERRGRDRAEWLYPTFENYSRINPSFYGEYGKDPTRYIDAAIALVERMLPTQWPTILRTALSGMAKEYDWHIKFPKPGQRELLPIAILLALFRALEAKEGG